jgi:hypothetical protein
MTLENSKKHVLFNFIIHKNRGFVKGMLQRKSNKIPKQSEITLLGDWLGCSSIRFVNAIAILSSKLITGNIEAKASLLKGKLAKI